MSKSSQPAPHTPGENSGEGVQIAFHFICKRCQQPSTRMVSRPGNLLYCKGCADTIKKERAVERVNRWRENHPEEARKAQRQQRANKKAR